MNEAYENLLTRRSCRKYREEQLKPADLDAILTAGTYAPTGRGAQSPLMVVLQKKEDIEAVEKLNAAVLGTPEAKPFYGAPTVVIVFGDTQKNVGVADGNMVIANLLNAANAVGVDSCYIWRAREAFESEEGQALKKKWGVPEHYAGVGHVILGYGLPEGKREAAPRKEGYVIRV